jgi:hypothetical protein
MEIPDIAWIAIAIFIAIIGFAGDFSGSGMGREGFHDPAAPVDTRDADIVKYVTKIYMEILERYPSSAETNDHRRAIMAGKRTFDDVRQMLTDSIEFQKKMKMQSNALTPELPKMISDSKLLRRLAQIYMEERGKTIPGRMVLPIKDIFVRLRYNEKALRFMLRHKAWTDFEEDIMLDESFSEKDLDDLLDKAFGGADKIIEDSEKEGEPDGANVNDKIDRMIADEDSDMSALLDDINKKGFEVFDKDTAALCSCGSGTGDCLLHKNVPVRPHYGNMVLRPEFAWSVPQQRPPVCTTLGKPALVQPVYLQSSLALHSTDLGEASDTGVGSIMPKFGYKEYVNVPIKGKCASSKPTSSTAST